MTPTEKSHDQALKSTEEYKTNVILDVQEIMENLRNNTIHYSHVNLLYTSIINTLDFILEDNQELTRKVREKRTPQTQTVNGIPMTFSIG